MEILCVSFISDFTLVTSFEQNFGVEFALLSLHRIKFYKNR